MTRPKIPRIKKIYMPVGYCHRRIVAEWLEAALGIEIPEMAVKKMRVTYGRDAEGWNLLAFNGWRGCAHGCRYCFGPKTSHISPEEFRIPQPRVGDILEDLDRDLQLLSQHDGPLSVKLGNRWEDILRPFPHVLLMFDCDPYSPPGGDLSLTRTILAKFNQYAVPFKVLTKAGRKAVADFDLYGRDDWFGISLTFLNEADTKYWEPGASSASDRLSALQEAHDRGIKTWISMEAVIDQKQAISLIEAIQFVDFIYVGKVDQNKEAEEKKTMSWPEFRLAAEEKLQELGKKPGIDYQIKRKLRDAR
jgi:DNA repair photolyase